MKNKEYINNNAKEYIDGVSFEIEGITDYFWNEYDNLLSASGVKEIQDALYGMLYHIQELKDVVVKYKKGELPPGMSKDIQ